MTEIALPIGFVIKNYRITKILGQGGFGVTYLAIDLDRKNLVAIKEHFPTALAVRGADGSVRARDAATAQYFDATLRNFFLEAELLIRFPHEALPSFRRLLEGGGTAYLIMDFEAGCSLKTWAGQQPANLAEGRFLKLLDPICEALQLLHRNQVFHRDIKPDNIIIRSDGTPVLIDFGIAHDVLREKARIERDREMLLHTEGFSPIEQYGPGLAGSYSDVYSLSATCYDLFSRRPLVDARTRQAAIKANKNDPLLPLSSTANVRLSKEFSSAIQCGLALEPECRPQSITEWKALLPTVRTDSTQKAGIWGFSYKARTDQKPLVEPKIKFPGARLFSSTERDNSVTHRFPLSLRLSFEAILFYLSALCVLGAITFLIASLL